MAENLLERLKSLSVEKGKPNPIEAWIATNLMLDPAKLELIREGMNPEYITYNHPIHGEITINRTSIHCLGSPKYGTFNYGFETKEFLAFLAGYTNTGKKPGLFHPILRMHYEQGIEARNRKQWTEEETNEEDDQRSRPYHTYRIT